MFPKLKGLMINKRAKLEDGSSWYGFYDVVAIFSLETIPKLEKAGVIRIWDNGFVKILNWRMCAKGGYKEIATTIFKQVFFTYMYMLDVLFR